MQLREFGQLLGNRESHPVPIDRARFIHQFGAALRGGGAYEALTLLNARVRHRFTCVDRFDSPVLRSVFMFDRENPDILSGGTAQAIDDTYASFIRQSKRPFFTEYSLQDARLGLHSARVAITAYVGVPIHLSGGRLWGVLSHHDFRPRAVPRDEPAVMQELAGSLAGWLIAERLAESDVSLAL